MKHDLKTWPEFYRAIISGEKTFEVRNNNGRGFQQGDVLNLREFDPDKIDYTGREFEVYVSYVLNGGQFGIEKGFIVMCITPNIIPCLTCGK